MEAPIVEAAVGIMESVVAVANVPSRLIEPRSDTTSSDKSCTSNSHQDTCETSVSSKTYTIPLVLGILLPIVAALIVFFILHRRHVRKQRLEDLNDRHASMDFGLGNVPQPGHAARKKKGLAIDTNRQVDMREKSSAHAKQQSMDMALESPYLLPPELQSSRESLHSLSRTLHQSEDPYRPVQQYGDGNSIRSISRFGNDNASMYTTSSHGPSRMQDLSAVEPHGPLSRTTPGPPLPRHASLPKYSSPMGPIDVAEKESSVPAAQPTPPPEAHLSQSMSPAPMAIQEAPNNPTSQPELLTAPAPALNRDSSISTTAAIRQSHNYLGSLINSNESTDAEVTTEKHDPAAAVQARSSSASIAALPTTTVVSEGAVPPRVDSMPVIQLPDEMMDGTIQLNPSPEPEKTSAADLYRESRYSSDFAALDLEGAELAAPETNVRRLSVGLRPLPPDTVTDTDDPEIRANRIRSFYKEYFDETKAGNRGQHLENYNPSYQGDAAYFDPDHNNFVMPYAQPVTRRAMTPPPRAPRFPGPPRANHGSMGGMRMEGRQMYPPGPYPQGPRAFSTSSGGNRGRSAAPKRPLPPPSALNSLPTPSKLKDDSFALMSAIDFAPPQTYRDRAASRSESPLGERRPYSPAVSAFTPTVSAFDELSAMPSPHMLRKSGTFTGLDFAPPKRFKDADTISDSGSIRSNRSGVSAMHNQAIRNGAYRVSRIPADTVFARDDLASTLRPKWDMRGSQY